MKTSCSFLLWSFASAVAAVPYAQYILTPKSRNILPASVYNVNGTVEDADSLTTIVGNATFMGVSAVTYDFGKNIAGIVSFNVSSATGTAEDEYIGISFTESSLWINSVGCDATADAGIDEALWFSVTNNGKYRASDEHQRGGFRYLNFTAVPQYTDEQLAEGVYSGYFHCEDDQLNRVWYAGAYTDELCTIDPTKGNSLVHLGEITSNDTIDYPVTWYNNYTVANGSSVLVDGAKRDRLVWPGDMAVAVPSMFVSTNDLTTIQNSLNSLLELQNASGALPYAGIPFGEIIPVWSFTYHLYSLIAINDYYLYTGNLSYLETNWNVFKSGLNYSVSFVDSTGLANVTTPADWLRFGMGGHNIEANSILYYTINLGSSLATVLNDSSSFVQTWPTLAASIKIAANDRLWDQTANLYRDNDTLPLTDLHPQDGNSWAILSNITLSMEQNTNISNALRERWTEYGAPAPEAGPTVSPFISSFELQAHYIAGRADSAVALMKLMWGDFMLDDPRMTNSTFIEGYSTNGDLHYAPYNNDPRISHAHGWATGPTSALTFYTAGLQVTSAAGKTWRIAPRLGGLKGAEAGYHTILGSFTTNVTTNPDGSLQLSFSTPENTTGTVSIEYSSGGEFTLTSPSNSSKDIVISVQGQNNGSIEIDNLSGGNYTGIFVVA